MRVRLGSRRGGEGRVFLCARRSLNMTFLKPMHMRLLLILAAVLWRLAPAAALLSVSATACLATAPFAAFEAQADATAPTRLASLNQGATVLLRWRSVGAENAAEMVANIAARLNRLAWSGLQSADIRTEVVPRPPGSARQAGPPDARLLVRGETLLQLTAAHAALVRSAPADLVEVWARNLRAAFEQPYIMTSIGELQVPVGESREFECGGRMDGPLQAESWAPDVVVAQADATSRKVRVRAVAVGTTLVRVRSGRTEALISAVVRKWAATVTEPVTLRISGPLEPNLWLGHAARVAVRRHLNVEQGAQATIQNVAVTDRGIGATVSAGGGGHFGFERRYDLSLAPATAPALPPARAVLSNDPEDVRNVGLLARTRLLRGETINFLWHHINRSSHRMELVVRLVNHGSAPAAVHVIGADGGPSHDEVFVGHAVMQRFMRAWQTQAGSVFELPPLRRCELSRRAMPPDQVVSGLAQLILQQGAEVQVETAAVTTPPHPWELEAVPAFATGPEPPLLQLPGNKRLELTHQVGKGWSFLRIGRTREDEELHPRLLGEYGVVHDISIQFDNGERIPAQLEVALRSGGGAARGAFEVDGRLHETRLLRGGDEEIIFRHKTDGEPVRAVRLRIIPQAGSNYPMTLIARSFVPRG